MLLKIFKDEEGLFKVFNYFDDDLNGFIISNMQIIPKVGWRY
jgi:Ca2+-binding EF-hand superfamily protein